MTQTQGRRAISTADVPIDQKTPLLDDGSNREPEIVKAENMPSDDYAADLAFNEEPVTILINPSTEKNAARHVPVWVNGKGCEVWNNRINGWIEMAYIPVGQPLTIKRKYLEVLARAKKDEVTTKHNDVGSEYIDNQVERTTSAVANISVMADKNPRGAAWFAELVRRNF